MIHLQHPALLWTLVLVLPILAFSYWRGAAGPGLRKWILIVLSLAGMAALVLALAGPYRVRSPQGDTTVFLIDLSSSVSDGQLDAAAREVRGRVAGLAPRTEWQAVGFAAYPIPLAGGLADLEAGACATRRLGGSAREPDFFENTDLEAALLYARAQIKQQGRIVLLTDGLETRGQAEQAVFGLDAQGIALEVVPLNVDAGPEVVLTSLTAPSAVHEGQNASLTITLDSSVEGPIRIEATHVPTGERRTLTENVTPGVQTRELPLDTRQADVTSYEVVVSAAQDTRSDNNRRSISVPILPKPLAAVLATDEASVATLERWLQDTARVAPWAGDDTLGQADLLIVADAGLDRLTTEQVTRIREQVRRGMGLWVLPGPTLIRNALLSEGSDLAELLPVKPLQYGKQSNPNTTAVFILDTSGSMTGARIQLAKEIARMAISHLNGHDKVGIVEFYGARRWAAPIQSAANRLDINRALNRLTAGGGTIILPALEEAHYALLNTSSTTKHIVVVSDAGVESGDYESVLRKIAGDNIAVSTVLVGPAAHTGFMADLSQWGRGAFFHAGDRFRLPDLNFKSVQNKSGAPQQQNDAPVASVFASSVLSGVTVDSLTPPADMLAVSPRPAAQVPLTLGSGRPLLSLWQYGLGQVAFWSVDLLAAEGPVRGGAAGQSWADLVVNQCRKLYRPRQPDWDLAWRVVHDRVFFTISPGPDVQAQDLQVVLQGQGRDAEALSPVRADGRHWAAQARDLAGGFYRATLNTTAGETLARGAFVIEPTPELSACRADAALLDHIQAAAGQPALSQPPERTGDLRVAALLLALLCLLTHVIVRRLPHGWLRRVAPAAVWFVVLLPAARSQAAQDPNLAYVTSRLNGLPQTSPTGDPVLALLCGDANQADSLPTADFAGVLQRGYALYKLERHSDAYETLRAAVPLAQTEEDQKYVLAWLLLTAQKAGRLADVEQALGSGASLVPYQIKALLLAYGLQGDLARAMALHDRVYDANGFTEDFKLEVTREILNLAFIDGRTGETRPLLERASAHTSDPGVGAALVKLHLLNGDRDLGRAEMERLIRAGAGPSGLLFLAQQAEQMAFYDLALQAAGEVVTHHPDYAYEAGLFRVRLTIRRGQPEEAATMLRDMADHLSLNDKQLFEVAQVYEQLARYPEAMALYQSLCQRTEAHDVLMRIAWLHEKRQDLSAAYETWHTLWTQCDQEHLLYQIQPRLLDLGARTAQLASLAVELEEGLESGGLDAKALNLLIDLYVSAGDSISAVELAKQYYGRDTAESLNRQQRIYLRCHEYGRCHRVLQRLLEIDPGNAQSYLQQLAVIALERGNERDALAASQAIAAAQGSQQVDAEYAAGVLAMMGRTAEAAQTYYRMLQDDPNNAELWLLWANTAQEAGEGAEAIHRLVQLLDETASDDVFTVAVDGLLNLDADRETLKTALASILLRLADDPRKIYFYRLAVDVLEDLTVAQPAPQDLLLLAAPHAPQRRAAFIREAQQLCARARDVECQLDLGVLLVTMDYELPPQFYMDLGKQFLEQGRESMAQVLFRHNGLLSENPSLGVEIADYHDRYGQFDKAATMIRECLCGMPDDLVLLMRSASYEEVTGNLPLAFRQYRRLYELSLGAMSLESVPASKGEAVSRQKQQVNAGDRYSLMAMQGLLVTDNPQTPLSDLCSQWAAKILVSIEGRTALSALSYQHWRDYDCLCVACGRVEQADETARRIMTACPESDLRGDMVQNRCLWGLYPAAMSWARDLDRSRWPETLLAWADVQDPNGPSQAANVIDALIQAWVVGRSEEAQRLLERLPGKVTTDVDRGERIGIDQNSLLIAHILGDSDRVKRLVARQIQENASRPAGQRRTSVQALARTAWTLLSPADRRWLVRELETAFGSQAEVGDLIEIARIHSGVQQYYPSEKAKAAGLAEILQYIEPDRRLAILGKAVADQPEPRRKLYLWDLLEQADFEWTAPETESFIRLFESQPPAQWGTQMPDIPPDSPTPSLWLALAENLLKDLPDNPAVNALTCLARRAAGQTDQAVALVSAVVDPWLDKDEITYTDTGMLQKVIEVLPPEALDAMLEDVQTVQEVMGPTAKGRLLEALIHQRRGRRTQARASISQAYVLRPDDLQISRRIRQLYCDTGHYRDLADLMAQRLYGSGQGTSAQWMALSELYLQCGMLPEALRATAQDTIEIIRNRSYLFLYHAAGDADHLRQALRKFYVDCRVKQFSGFLRWPRPDSPGGILGLEAPLLSSTCVSALLGRDESMTDELPRYWRALQAQDRDMTNMAEGLAAIHVRSGRAQQVLADLEQQERSGLAQIPKACALRWHLMTQGTAAPTPEQIDALVGQIESTDWTAWRWIARAYAQTGQPEKARRAYQWLCLNEWLAGLRSSDDLKTTSADADAWQVLDPQARSLLEPVLGPNPFVAFDPLFEAMRLDWLSRAWPERDLSTEVEVLESRFRAPRPLDTPIREALALREALMGYYLRHDNLDRYSLHLHAVLSELDELCNPVHVIDFVRLAGACDDPERVERFLAHSEALIRWLVNDGRLPGFAAVPQLALLAVAYDRNKNASSSEAVFGTMRTLLAEPSQTALWLVDALDRCGRQSEAETLIEQLSREGLMPRSRAAIPRDSDPSRKDLP
ncbi:MAG: VWA domain-containing protein [Phycisphaerae bacterium]|nr:VWA domain-containing protein [Phycisphaerae bacterium]